MDTCTVVKIGQVLLLLLSNRNFISHRIVKCGTKDKVECYDIEYQNVQLGNSFPLTFETTERRDVRLILLFLSVIVLTVHCYTSRKSIAFFRAF